MRLPSVGKFVALINLCALLIFAFSGCANKDDSENPSERSTTPITCGNGQLDEGEVCDATQLGDETCVTQGASAGQLGCDATCLSFDLSECAAPWTCGDGIIQSPEICDGADLGETDCASLGFDKGTLGCANSCLAFDTTACVYEGQCAPKTCATIGAQCGAVDDGCGGSLDCGECAGDLSCGGGGEPNQCGATCPRECPQGFSCNTLGECVGSSNIIAVNMPTATVEVVARLNGQALQPTPDCGDTFGNKLANIHLRNLQTDTVYSAAFPCDGAAMSMTVTHGTYQVKIRGLESDMPNIAYIAHEALEIGADRSITADMPTSTVSFLARIDGESPNCDEQSDYHITGIKLTNLTSSSVDIYRHELRCDGSSPSAIIPHGTYRVSVSGYGQIPSSNRYSYIAHDSRVIDSDTTIIADTLTARVQLLGKFKGETPQATPDCDDRSFGSKLTYIQLTNLATQDTYDYDLPCDGSALSTTLPFGTYKVEIMGAYAYMPTGEFYVAHEAMVIDSDKTIVADLLATTVDLVAKLNGQIPEPTRDCGAAGSFTRRGLAVMIFTNVATGVAQSKELPCDGAPGRLTLVHGTYRVTVWGLESNMPRNNRYAFPYIAHEALVIDGEQTVVADMPTSRVHLVAKHNGQTPEPTSACNDEPNHELAYVMLKDVRGELSTLHPIPCNGDPAPIDLPHGIYNVYVRGNNSMMPSRINYAAHKRLLVNSDRNIVADMPTSTVNLRALFNGERPLPTNTCDQQDNFNWLATIVLKNEDSETPESLLIPCNGDSVNKLIPHGTYRISVRGDASEMLNRPYPAIPKIVID